MFRAHILSANWQIPLRSSEHSADVSPFTQPWLNVHLREKKLECTPEKDGCVLADERDG